MLYSEVKKCLKEVDKDTLRDLIKQFGEDLVWQYYDGGYELSSMEEAYQGQWKDDIYFVQSLLEDIGAIPADLPHYIYIDWERTARDIMMDYVEIE